MLLVLCAGIGLLVDGDGENLPSAVPMNEEGGNWKVSAIAGSALSLDALNSDVGR